MTTSQQIRELLQQRILILDGAMGPMLQQHRLEEKEYRGERFARHPVDLRNNNEVLSLVRPEIVEQVHAGYLDAGADIIETNTFNANAISMADYRLEEHCYELNVASARLARRAVAAKMAADPARPRLVAGAIGPTNR